MDKNKTNLILQIIENKEWKRLVAIATYELRQKQTKLEGF